METAVQIWGASGGGTPNFADIAGKLDKLLAKGGLTRILCGWTLPEAMYQRIRDYVAPSGVALYLWFPVFSEMSSLRPFAPLMDREGKHLYTPTVGTAEEFRFRCPAAPENLDFLMEIFENRFAHLPIDGVFLDRVRYPSFFSGLEGVFSCFCPHCRAVYRADGLTMEDIQDAYQRVLFRAARQDPNPLTLSGYSEKGFTFQDEALRRFFACKSKIVTRSVARLADFFRQKGLSIGLDLFTPALGYFAGQSYPELLPLADFVKPMLYRYTDAPAGLPYELKAYDAAFHLRGKGAEALLSLIGARGDDDFASMVQQEMRHMQAAGTACRSKAMILPGMEINRVDPIAPMTPERVAQSAAWLIHCGAEGIAASWNLVDTPTENLEAFLEKC